MPQAPKVLASPVSAVTSPLNEKLPSNIKKTLPPYSSEQLSYHFNVNTSTVLVSKNRTLHFFLTT